jgi:lipopolysaccharide/colanic/teichoic acid biosynthesis glycosyltransferase
LFRLRPRLRRATNNHSLLRLRLREASNFFLLTRLIDITISLILLIVLSPVLVIVAIGVKLGSIGTVFFTQQRVGRNGELFSLYKFRTMRNDKKGNRITIGNDNRITGIGRILRKYKLDELPQLVNVIKGEMSLVGPRPEISFYVDQYSPWQRKLLTVRPGITDLSSLVLAKESELLAAAPDPEKFYISQLLRQKLRLSFIYGNHPSTGSYFLLLWWTFLTLLHIPLGRITKLRNLLASYLKIPKN